MAVSPQHHPEIVADARPLRLGFVPLSDCAPIATAREMGIFERYGLEVELSRETDWNRIRDKIYLGQLDASQSIAGIAFALGMGFPELRCEVVVPLILNLHGAAVTLSRRLDPVRVGSGEGLAALLGTQEHPGPLTLATTHPFSSHHILLRQWLQQHELETGRDVRIVFLPPQQMPDQLATGQIDGFCVGEPWNSKAILAESGWCPVTSRELGQGHPEKVLLLSGRLLEQRRGEAIRLVAALLDACKLCQDPEFSESLVHILSQPAYTGTSPEILRHELREDRAGTLPSRPPIYHGQGVNRPTVGKASWVLAGLTSIAALPPLTAGSLSRIYREDLYHEALNLSRS